MFTSKYNMWIRKISDDLFACRHIGVDVYGKGSCSDPGLACDRSSDDKCLQMLHTSYKVFPCFYTLLHWRTRTVLQCPYTLVLTDIGLSTCWSGWPQDIMRGREGRCGRVSLIIASSSLVLSWWLWPRPQRRGCSRPPQALAWFPRS